MLLNRTFLLVCLSAFLLAACGGGGGGSSTPSTTSDDTLAPTVPQNLSGATISQTQVDLSWSASADVGGGVLAGYRLYRDGALLDSVTAGTTTYSDTGLSANTSYSYTVVAYDNAVPANESAQSLPVSVTMPAVPPHVDTTPPSVPQNLSATAVSAVQISLSWNGSTDSGGGTVAGYWIHRNGSPLVTVTGTSYSDTGLSGNTTYNYAVSAFDNAVPANESVQSSPAMVTTPIPADTSPPVVPQNLAANSVRPTQVDLTWSASMDVGGGVISGYRIFRNGALVTLVSTTAYSDTSLTPNTMYSYTVSAYDDAVPPNESAQSSPPMDVTTPQLPDTDPPSVPQNVVGSAVSQTQVDVSWTASNDIGGGSVEGYKVFRNSIEVANVTSGTGYSDTGLTSNTTYSYTVSAYDDAAPPNESAQSSLVSVTTPTPPDTTPPTVPQNLTANAVSPTQVNLVWEPASDTGGTVAGYRLYRGSGLIATVTSGTSYNDTSVTANTSYSYQVSAYDDAIPANESAQSLPVDISTPVDPGFPISYTFSSADISDWSTVSDTGTAANWQIVSGAYQQDIMVGNRVEDQTYVLGTYSYLGALTTLTAYRFSVDITPLRDEASKDAFDGQDVGVMFRYQDNNNYYRVSFNSRDSFARLEKKVGGNFTTLATNARGYLEERSFNIAVNVVSNLIQVTRDGDPVFSAYDPDLSSGTVALYCQDKAEFDNVLVDVNDPNPTIVVSTPLAHSVQTGTTVTASAAVTNMPAGGSVEFEFGGAPCGAATESSPGSGFYTASCGTASQGDYFLAGQGLRALLLNSSDGLVASDENLRVGIQGDSYVTMGDSITLGSFDFFSGDNQSLDSRVIGQQGYQARLNDLLTASTGYPNIVFNQGVGGDKTTNALTRIDSIMERHPGSNKVLLMLGTNDSGGGTPLSQAAFQANMQSLVNTATGQGKTVWVAKPPPVLPYASNATRNADIQGYNTAIDSLTSSQPGPEFFGFFYDDNDTPGTTTDDYERLSMYHDKLHPNALGLRIMAGLWDNALAGTLAVPFYLDRLCNRLVSASCTAVSPTNHKQNLRETGYPLYIDETYTLTSIPPVLADGIWIQTANAEQSNTSASYIDFTVDRPVTVYVAYDADAGVTPPGWLTSSFTDAGIDVQSTDPSSPTLHVYLQNYAAGPVSLGGNLATGASGANSNYLVIVVSQ